jgi:hypothetical protein
MGDESGRPSVSKCGCGGDGVMPLSFENSSFHWDYAKGA